jgi:ABC-type proline/glycine betaine transport system substrate-binding protein
LMAQLNPVQIVVRIEATRSNPKSIARLDQTIRACEFFISGSKNNENSLMNQAGGIRDISIQQLARLRNHCFKLGVFLAAPGKIDSSLGNVLGAVVSGPSFSAEEKNFFRGGFCLSDISPEKISNRRFFPEKEPFTLAEAACALCLPAPPIDECPGLPDWKALLEPDCVKALSVVETEPKARFLSGPLEWGGTDPERIAAMGLDFEVINAGSDGALSADLVAAIKRKQPIVAWSWEPYWIPALYPGEFVKWPEYEDACYDDPAWGMNPDKTHDCGRPNGQMWKAAWADGEKIWPKAYDVWRKFTLDAKTAGELVFQSDVDGMDTQAVAEKWIAENESTWKPWLE